MPGSITPLPIMLEEEDRKIYERLQAPKSMVVRYGYQKLVAELPYDGSDKPGCGSKLVIQTQRGVELGEMLTTTCANSGCGKSVSRKQMLEYIDRSGGKNYPFTTQGKVVRVATIDDMQDQARLDADKPGIVRGAKALIAELGLEMHLVEVERLLGGERIIFYYTAERYVDFRELVRRLASEHQTRVEMHQVNAREEARLVADYERCGQYCCCKNFLKVLKPVSMRSAKVQKATLDPQKISGRCGRLMCCLRYEDQTYEDLRKRLPHRKSLVETEDGVGEVLDTQILTQLVLVRVEGQASPAAYPLENLRVLAKEEAQTYRSRQRERAAQAASDAAGREKRGDRGRPRGNGAPPSAAPRAGKPRLEESGQPEREHDERSASNHPPQASSDDAVSHGYSNDRGQADTEGSDRKQRPRRRRRGRGGHGRGPRGGQN